MKQLPILLSLMNVVLMHGTSDQALREPNNFEQTSPDTPLSPQKMSQQKERDQDFICGCKHEDTFALFCAPIKFTPSGMRCFLKHMYNHRFYRDFIAHNPSHLIQFLNYGKQGNQDMVYMQSTLRLFHNKLKSTNYLTTGAIGEVLDSFNQVFTDYFQPTFEENILYTIGRNVKNIFYHQLRENFTFFKQDPNSFLDDVSSMIAQSLHDAETDTYVTQELFRQTIVRFLEQGIGKIIWSPLDQNHVWDDFKAIADKLTCLAKNHILQEEELDDLFRSLVERFCYFIELSGSELTVNLIDTILKEIESAQLYIFCLDEQEEFMQTKAHRLIDELTHAQAKIIARKKGLITDILGY